MFFDIGLIYDRETRTCGPDIGPDGDLVIDETSITPVLLSIGLDRRAAPDDELPQGRSATLAPATFSELRGCIGDAFDREGRLSGARTWLLDRAKETEETRLIYTFWLEEALVWAEPETGTPAEIEVAWIRPEVLGYRIFVGDASLSGSSAL